MYEYIQATKILKNMLLEYGNLSKIYIKWVWNFLGGIHTSKPNYVTMRHHSKTKLSV